MHDPVISLRSGITYECEAIEWWLEKHSTEPGRQEALQMADLVPNKALVEAISYYNRQPWRRGILG